ncbi:gamma-glutamylcyclotransferase [Magnetospirillum sulfuroxidans]|uniref:glutathione-specific gamma-glutamylcyclotransferase n=1 Tax=Magnetospirillum sulfuroxidans TaxID=611300 RepID=A0ABS5IBR6_9PROT|nr:gamma-glutamylcyclotransferase [Magnetospirillum sulfuroxidans]MBR9971867.1 gamma-glutamylcyclotransferase [Magnetospirillum sulfuroxidans]
MDTSDDRKAKQRSTPAHGAAQGDVWVFAYGSLMWNPDFTPQESVPARLFGWRRALCILSTIYRGTEDRPGLVLGLDQGGSCRGRALRVAAADWPTVKARLDARELPTLVYIPRFLPVRLENGATVAAYAYVVDRRHRQYWRGEPAEALRLLRQGHGKGGSARDYLAQTVGHLSQMGIRAGALHRLLKAVDEGD